MGSSEYFYSSGTSAILKNDFTRANNAKDALKRLSKSDFSVKEKSDKFSYQIQKKYKIPVKLVDERLTTKEARERIKEGVDMSLRSSNDIHQVSAQIILESWFRISR